MKIHFKTLRARSLVEFCAADGHTLWERRLKSESEGSDETHDFGSSWGGSDLGGG
jgi:hypothetical protein